MNKGIKLADGLYFVGAFDDKLRIFDIVCETPFGTSYNSYLLIGSEKTALIETVKKKFSQEFFERLDHVLKLENKTIDFIIHNHTEPDHSGSSKKLIEKYPNAVVIGTENALTYLKHIWNDDTIATKQVPDQIKELNLGNYKLRFFPAPFLHWPDSMFSYCPELKTVFTCDFLGTHYSHHGIFDETIPEGKDTKDYFDSMEYYYKCIFSPFSKYVLRGAKILKDIQKENGINMVCCSHGPIIKKYFDKLLASYEKYATIKERFEEKISIFYTSAYGYTREMAMLIAKGIEKQNIPVTLFDVLEHKDEEIVKEIQSSKGVLFGSPTILGDCLPNISRLLAYPFINPIINASQFSGCFGSYGWSGEACSNIDSRLEQLKLKLPLEPIKIRFKPGKNDESSIMEYGEKFARAVKGEKINERIPKSRKRRLSSAYSPYGKAEKDNRLKLWKCIVCGECFIGIDPPEVCDACLADGEIWVMVKIVGLIEEEKSDYEGTIAIVGASASGVTAAKIIRQRNTKCKILLFSDEGLPYYRPSVSKTKLNSFFEREWYTKQNIDLIYDHVKEIKESEKMLVTTNKKEYKYDRVIICTGSKSINIFKTEAKNIFTIYTAQHTKDILQAVSEREKCKIGIIGAGSLGIEIAEVINDKLPGKVESITFVEMTDRILPRFFDPESSEIFKTLIEKHGPKFLFDHKVDKIQVDPKTNIAQKLIFKESLTKELDIDILILTIGQENVLELPKQLKLEMNGTRVKVNEKMETSKKDVYAAGNVCQIGRFTIANFANAVKKGEIAGLNSIGIEEKFGMQFGPYALAVFGINAVSYGKMTDNYLKKKIGETYVRFSFDEKNQMCGAIVVGDEVSHVKIQKSLDNKITVPEIVSTFFTK